MFAHPQALHDVEKSCWSAEKFQTLKHSQGRLATFHCLALLVCSLECSLKNFRARISLKRKHSANHKEQVKVCEVIGG